MGEVMRKVFVVLFCGILSMACGILELSTGSPTIPVGEWRCGPLPETFQESDLIGEWEVTDEGGTSSDVIILRGDGTYQQRYSKSNGESYESPWNRWWVEHRPSGGVYVHLEEMRYCEGAEECRIPRKDETFWDFCENRRLQMVNEVILAVVEAQEPHPLYGAAPRGIILLHMRPSSQHSAGSWRLRD